MIPPDGISQRDWTTILELGVGIANAAMVDNDTLVTSLTLEILNHLNELERKYGKQISILATKADYIESANERISLYLQAWNIAKERSDNANLVLISSSLAELYIEDFYDFDEGKKWLTEFEVALGNCWNDDDYADLQRLRTLTGSRPEP